MICWVWVRSVTN